MEILAALLQALMNNEEMKEYREPQEGTTLVGMSNKNKFPNNMYITDLTMELLYIHNNISDIQPSIAILVLEAYIQAHDVKLVE